MAFGFFFSLFLLKRGRSLVCDKQPPSTTKLPARAGIIHGLCTAGEAQQAEHLLLRRREAKEAARKLMSVTLRGIATVVAVSQATFWFVTCWSGSLAVNWIRLYLSAKHSKHPSVDLF